MANSARPLELQPLDLIGQRDDARRQGVNGEGERVQLTSFGTLQTARERHVTVVISSGDFGVVSQPCPGAAVGSAPVMGVNLLASDPLALAAGGTSLRASHTTGAYIGESAWASPPDPPAIPDSQASGGGFSKVFRRLAFQDGAPLRLGCGPIEAARRA
jgi:hypothetical protein